MQGTCSLKEFFYMYKGDNLEEGKEFMKHHFGITHLDVFKDKDNKPTAICGEVPTVVFIYLKLNEVMVCKNRSPFNTVPEYTTMSYDEFKTKYHIYEEDN